jgi:hypothetical protein
VAPPEALGGGITGVEFGWGTGAVDVSIRGSTSLGGRITPLLRLSFVERLVDGPWAPVVTETGGFRVSAFGSFSGIV